MIKKQWGIAGQRQRLESTWEMHAKIAEDSRTESVEKIERNRWMEEQKAHKNLFSPGNKEHSATERQHYNKSIGSENFESLITFSKLLNIDWCSEFWLEQIEKWMRKLTDYKLLRTWLGEEESDG